MATISFRQRALALVMAGVLASAPLVACGQRMQAGAPAEDVEMKLYEVTDGVAAEAEACSTNSYGDTDDFPVDFNTEEYAAIDETGFVSVQTKPLSTVSADVDTASWCNVRRMVRQGYGLSTEHEDAIEMVRRKQSGMSPEELMDSFPLITWMVKHAVLTDTLSDTFVNVLLFVLIWLRVKKMEH